MDNMNMRGVDFSLLLHQNQFAAIRMRALTLHRIDRSRVHRQYG